MEEKYKYNFKKIIPRIYKQKFGDCTENCLTMVYSVLQKNKEFEPSRLFIVYENKKNKIEDVVKNIGFCEEKQYPYNEENLKNKPNEEGYKGTKEHRLDGFIEINRDEKLIDNIKKYLEKNIPVIISLKIRGSGIKSGILNTENADPGNGKHCMLLIGWDDIKKEFDILNSWGEKWGNKGFGKISYEYINDKNLCKFVRCYPKVIEP